LDDALESTQIGTALGLAAVFWNLLGAHGRIIFSEYFDMRVTILALGLGVMSLAQAQNLNLDKHNVKIPRTSLPQDPLQGQNEVDSLAPRTYQIKFDWGYDFTSTVYYQQPTRESALMDRLKLEGWKEYTESPAHLNVLVRFTDFQMLGT